MGVVLGKPSIASKLTKHLCEINWLLSGRINGLTLAFVSEPDPAPASYRSCSGRAG